MAESGTFKLQSPLANHEGDFDRLSGFPRLKPAYILRFKLPDPRHIGRISSGETLMQYALTDPESGSITTAKGYEDVLEGKVVAGGDWLVTDPDGEYARPNVQTVIETADGVFINLNYTAIVRISQPVLEIMTGAESAKTIPFGSAVNTVSFKAGDSKYKHLDTKAFVGNGRFIVNRDPFFVEVETRISEVVPAAEMD